MNPDTHNDDLGSELPLLLFGAGGHAKVVIDALECVEQAPTAVVDDSPHAEDFLGYPLVKNAAELWRKFGRFRFHVAVGSNQARERIFTGLLGRGGIPQSIVHPQTIISRHAEVGAGTFVAAGAILNPKARVGENCIINTGAIVEHDCEIGAHSHICPGVRLAGNVRVGSGVMIGTGSNVIPGIEIGAGVTIGAGSVIVRGIPARSVAMGVPARVTRVIPVE